MKPLRLHIQNPEPAAGRLRMEPQQLLDAVSAHSELAERLAVTVATGLAVPSLAADAEILVSVVQIPLASAKQQMPRLKWVQVTSAGVEGLLNDAPADVRLTNASGVHAEKGGEFILTAALMLAYDMPHFVESQQHQRWSPTYGPPLRASRITMLGVGDIGGHATTLLRHRGAHVTGVSRSGKTHQDIDRMVDLSRLDDVLTETDILVSTLPATPETEGLIDRQRLAKLPRGAGVIVVGRASPLDYDAILDRLDDGSLRGAILDVFHEEPIPPDHRLWRTPRLLITPHCAVDDHTVYMDRCVDILVANLERYVAGRELRNLVDTKTGY